LIGPDFSFILWLEIIVVYVEDGLKGIEGISHFLTAWVLNGLVSAVKKQHVREIKCITAGAPYCEWEIT
jgi:predicted hydrocarbon binding protein